MPRLICRHFRILPPSNPPSSDSPRNLATLRNLVIGLCALDGARHGKTASFLPSFRRRAQNDCSLALALVTESLLDGG